MDWIVLLLYVNVEVNMHLNSFRPCFSVIGILVLVVSIVFFPFAVAEEQVSIPIPVPLLGEYGQAGLAFNGLPWDVSLDISALWRSNEGELSFVIHGDITALYRWKYDQGEVSLLNVKLREKDADSLLLEGAKEQSIIAFFLQGEQLYGIDGTNGRLLTFGANGWQINKHIDWHSVAQSIGLESMTFVDASKKPYNFVKTDGFLYCLIPRPLASPLLLSVNLETQECFELDFPYIKSIQAFQNNDLLVKADSGLKRFNAVNQTFTDVFYIDGAFVYDGEQSVLFYELDGLLYESEDLVTSRAICTPAMSKISTLIALPQHKLAVYGDRGISVVNTLLSPGKTLRIEESFPVSTELFQLANPDVTIEMVNTTVPLDSQFATNDDNLDIITTLNNHVFEYAQKGYLAPLSTSMKLQEIAQTYYPQILEAITYNDELYAMPMDFGVICYQADAAAWQEAGSPHFPKNLDSFFRQVEQFATTHGQDYSQSYLEEILYDLSLQYSAQYATNSAPVQFDTPVYRTILSHIKNIANKGITGSTLYFSAYTPGFETPYHLDELGKEHTIPFLFPVFEPNQQPRLLVSLAPYVINGRTKNLDVAIRYLEFVSMYSDHALQYSLSPQYYSLSLDIADQQRQVIDLALFRLQDAPIDMDPLERQEKTSALERKYDLLESREPLITDAGLSFYRKNASTMSLQPFGFYDFVVSYESEPSFVSFLYGSMSEDELIMLLNARADSAFASSH